MQWKLQNAVCSLGMFAQSSKTELHNTIFW